MVIQIHMGDVCELRHHRRAKKIKTEGTTNNGQVTEVTGSGEIHASGLSGVYRLEAAPEVAKGRLDIRTTRRFIREVKATLRVIVVLCARANDIRV